MKDDSENHSRDQEYHSGQWLSVIQHHYVINRDLSIGQESLTWEISWACIDRGGIWKGDILIADIEELKNLDASEV